MLLGGKCYEKADYSRKDSVEAYACRCSCSCSCTVGNNSKVTQAVSRSAYSNSTAVYPKYK